MILIILNFLVLFGGFVLVLFQFVKVTASKRKIVEKLRIYIAGGHGLLLLAFVSIILSIIASRPLLLTGKTANILIATAVGTVIYIFFIIIWLRLKVILAKELIQTDSVKKNAFSTPHLWRPFMNLTVYGLIYAFAVVFFIIVLTAFLGGN